MKAKRANATKPTRRSRTRHLMPENVLPRIAPKLRMIADGDDAVNMIRAQVVPGMQVTMKAADRIVAPVRDFAGAEAPTTPRAGPLRKLSNQVEASVFITRTSRAESGDDTSGKRGGNLAMSGDVRRPRERGALMSGKVRIADIPKVAGRPEVLSIELAEGLRPPRPTLGSGGAAAPQPTERQVGGDGGKNAIIGIIDVSGFDFAHGDFLDSAGRTRFLTIWDQGGERRSPPAGFDYGSEITAVQMNAALTQQKQVGGINATAYEPQSQMERGSHGTHVASIGAGNLGVCRKAEIAAVLIDVGNQLDDRRLSFYDSTRLADAVDYLLQFADKRGKPISINISLGTNGHAHDGSSAISRWIDSALTVPGRSVCVAAGNAGQEGPQSEDDLGYLVGRIHTSGRIPAKGLTHDIEWLVIGSGIVDVSENELEIWYSPADRISVQVQPPGEPWTDEIEPGQYIENRQLKDGSFFSIYNELYHPSNGANYIALYLSPFYSDATIKGVRSGTWRIRLRGVDIRDGRFDGWIERDDPQPVGGGSFWAFPAIFSSQSNVDRSSISSLACGHNVVAVANLDSKIGRVNISSSQGPTRDARSKPEIAAPGTDIVAANGFSTPAEAWIDMTGTSMASPYVAGVIGLMLSESPRLTAAQILGIIQRTARPLPGSPYDWKDDAGFGAVDPTKCLEEASIFLKRKDVT